MCMGTVFFSFFCQYIFYKDGQIANRILCLLLGTMRVKSLVQGLNAAATAGFEPRTV